MTTVTADQILDVQGLSCPMPLLKARQALLKMEVGQVLQVISTDRGSIKDFQGWAKTARNVELLAQEEETLPDGKHVHYHYVKRTR
jgi:TusA-related sulfurtransferase